MEARVNQSSRYGVIIAFSGREYVKYEWRLVPAGCEAEAERHPYLEIKPVELQEAGDDFVIPPSYSDPQPEQPPETTEPEPVKPEEQNDNPPKKPRKRR